MGHEPSPSFALFRTYAVPSIGPMHGAYDISPGDMRYCPARPVA